MPPSRNAEEARRWRESHPDRYAASKAKQAARRRAFVKLAEMYPEDFDRLLAAELLK